MKNSSIDFGTLAINSVSNTDNNKSPLVVRNDGNLVANITYISINESPWQSYPDNTEYFQFKIDNDSTEINSFNWTASITTWTNLTNIANYNNTAVAYLNYQDANDEAEIDIKIKVPENEPPGHKQATIYIIGQGS
jgi:hypothetical protein